jgi:hypothetical protein
MGQFLYRQWLFAIARMLDGILIYLAQTSGNGSKYRHDAGRHLVRDPKQPFHYQLTCEINIGLVSKNQRDQRYPTLVQGAHFYQAGQTSHGYFHRHRHKPLDLFRAAARRLGRNLYLYICYVRECIDR